MTADERALLERKMREAGTANMGAYLRKMALDGYILRLDLPELKESWYWSSTEYDSYYAWLLGVGNGYRHFNTKSNGNYVRPVLAYLIENIIRTEPESLSPR